MRKIVLLLGPVAATMALFACEDSGSGTNTGIFTSDAALFEAAPPGDGNVPDTAVDAPETPKSVTVSVVRGAGPAAGVTVVFHDAAGAVLETKATGADGKASSSIGSPPAQASILLGTGSRRHIVTWTAVVVGDELLVRDPGDNNTGGTYDVTTQGNFADGGAAGLNASIGACMGYNNASPITVYMNPDCVRPSTAILARAFPPGIATIPLAYAFAKGKTPGPNDGGAGGASTGPWLAPGNATITPKNLPLQAVDTAVLYEIADTLGFENPSGTINRINPSTTFKVAPGFADAYQAAVRVTPNANPGSTLTIAKRGAPAANTDVDFAAPLPTIDNATLTSTTIARPQVDWTTLNGAPLTATDGGAVVLSWYDSRENQGSWTFIVPPTAKTAKAPAMPAAAEAWLPHGTNDAGAAVSFSDPLVIFADADLLPDYAAFRRQVGLVVPVVDTDRPDARAILPANGTLKLTAFRTPPPTF